MNCPVTQAYMNELVCSETFQWICLSYIKTRRNSIHLFIFSDIIIELS